MTDTITTSPDGRCDRGVVFVGTSWSIQMRLYACLAGLCWTNSNSLTTTLAVVVLGRPVHMTTVATGALDLLQLTPHN